LSGPAQRLQTSGFARLKCDTCGAEQLFHESNLKKQGVLPMTFANPADYDKVKVDDSVDITGLAQLAPGKPVTVVLQHKDGSSDSITCNHTLSQEQIAWFKAGSALNYVATQAK